MFAIEFTAGVLAGSTALLADSLDMLGDALVYGFSLYVVARADIVANTAVLGAAVAVWLVRAPWPDLLGHCNCHPVPALGALRLRDATTARDAYRSAEAS